MKSLDKAKKLSLDRTSRAREMKESGRRVMGYICLYPPVELIHAAGFLPFRLTGSTEPLTRADECMETLMCPFVRSCFDLCVKPGYEFIEGFIWPHTCDNVQKSYDIFKHYVPRKFFHYLDVPHMIGPTSLEFFTEELERLKKGLEEFAGTEITDEKLRDSIRAYNDNRRLLRELSSLRKHDPPLLAGSEMLEVMLSVTAMPVEEANEMLDALIEEVREREGGREKRPRLLVYGSEIDHPGLFELIEDCGADVVIEDICVGTKYYLHDVSEDGEPLENLARHYLGDITCPRTFRPWPGTREADLDSRFGYIKELAREYKAQAAILYIIMFCDTFEFDAPDVRDYLKSAGIESLHIEDDYRLSNREALKTRIEAFLEMIG